MKKRSIGLLLRSCMILSFLLACVTAAEGAETDDQKRSIEVSGVAVVGTVYTTSSLRDVEIVGTAESGGQTVEGTFELDRGQVLRQGTGDYRWTFTPEDEEQYETAHGTVSIQVEVRQLVKIEVEGVPDRTEYEHGDRFEYEGVTVYAYFADAMDDPLDVTRHSAFEFGRPLTAGQDEVSVSYGNLTVKIGGITVSRKRIEFAPVWSGDTVSIFDGTEKSVAVINMPEEGVAVTYEGSTGIDAGVYTASASFALADGYSPDCYELAVTGDTTWAWRIEKADGGSCADEIAVDVDDKAVKRIDLGRYIPEGGGALEGDVSLACGEDGALTEVSADGVSVSFRLSDSAAAGETALSVRFSTKNYSGITVTIAVRIAGVTALTAERTAVGKVYDGAAVTAADFGPRAMYGGEAVPGTWSLRRDGAEASPVSVADSGAYELVFTPDAAGSGGSIPVTVEVTKAVPAVTVPDGLEILPGQALGTVPLPAGWAWDDAETAVTAAGSFPATFVPEDTVNYHTVRRDLAVTLKRVVPDGSGSGSGSGSDGGSGPDSSPPPETVSTDPGGQEGSRTTARPAASVSGDSARSAISPAVGRRIVDQAAKNGSGAVVIAPAVQGDVSEVQVTIPAGTVGDLGRRTDADVVVDTPVARIAVDNSALTGLSGGDVTISARRQDSVLSITVRSGQEVLTDVEGGLTVTAPAEGAAPGTVAVLIGEDGSRRAIRKSVADPARGTLTIPLEGSARVEILDNSRSFADVPASDWAAEAVAFVSGHELFAGTGGNAFSPDVSMTRGMMAVVLHNLEDGPDSGGSSVFTDVPDSAFYAGAVAWAAGQGILSGYAGGAFGPDDDVTREQLAVMLYRHAGSPAAPSGQLSRFADPGAVSGYARAALEWAVANGIVNGTGDGVLDPRGRATRAQAARMLMAYVEMRYR